MRILRSLLVTFVVLILATTIAWAITPRATVTMMSFVDAPVDVKVFSDAGLNFPVSENYQTANIQVGSSIELSLWVYNNSGEIISCENHPSSSGLLITVEPVSYSLMPLSAQEIVVTLYAPSGISGNCNSQIIIMGD